MSTCAALTPFTLYRAAAGPESSLTLHRLPNLSVAGSIKGYSRPLLSARRRHGSNRRSALFVNTVEQLEFMSESNSNSSSAHPTYTEIVVVRHGETEWNAGRKIQGHTDVELNEAGRQQAALVIFQVIKEPGLRERHLGDLQGLALSEASKVCPQAYEAFLSHDPSQDIPGGGESLDTLYERCTSSFQRIAAKHRGERVVVVSHGGTIRALHKRACPDKRPGTVLNTSVHVFHLSDGDQWSIKSWGDVSHLSQTGFIKSGFGGDRTSG
ncbi:Phosphoglycerate mutase-like protein 4 [Linum perenne]